MDRRVLKDLHKTVMMKLGRVDYTSVDLVEGYHDAESIYKQLRNRLKNLEHSVVWLMTYEYGGDKMKSLFSRMAMITTTSKVWYLSNRDIYEANGAVGLALSKIGLSSGLNEVSKNYSKAYMNISKYKSDMNNKLSEQLGKIAGLRDQSCVIDRKRKKVSSVRYDLEMERQSGDLVSSSTVKKELEQEFKSVSNMVLGDMRKFIGSDGVSGVLQSVADIHHEFCVKTSQALSEVK